jgi:NAD(P)-dependent dehydrogenase (short-subunit alcohol dehydrogenase family)
MKYAIVTGGARGLGLGIVRALLTDEVVDRIAVIDRALVPAPADVGDRVEGFDGDVTDATQIHAAVEKITLSSVRIPTCYATMRVAESQDGLRADGTPSGTAWRSGDAMSS